MEGFSEEELILLNNYIYMDCSVNYSGIDEALEAYGRKKDGKRIFDPGDFPPSAGGGMKGEDAALVFQKLNKAMEKGGSLEGVRITRSLNEGNVRGLCFEKPNGEAAVIFRGTGGSYEAWEDNLEGQYIKDTDMQRIAADFIKYDCGGYKNLTVSGHSKGGNLAQYVTVVCGAGISRCVSLDGQGFSRDFIKKYEKEIEEASEKISSICAYNDYVNILLTSIAGETVYMRNKNKGPVGAHSSFSLLEHGEFDEEGRVIRDPGVSQGFLAKALDAITDDITLRLEEMPGEGNSAFTGLLGALVANAMCSEKEENDIDEDAMIRSAVGRVYEYVDKTFHLGLTDHNDIKLKADSIYSDSGKMSESLTDLNKKILKMENDMERINMIERNLSGDIIAGLCLSVSMSSVKERISEDIDKLEKISSCLNDMRIMYQNTEKRVCELADG
ncbi:MAG: DUF2974 domain-containing protein [Lachnospiraceae bacterium]|nr:DUF2974 domain-containing protein [Lachnospiraceae bacterium]